MNFKTSIFYTLFFVLISCVKDNPKSNPNGNGNTECEIISKDIKTTRTLVNRVSDPKKPDYCVDGMINITDGAGLIIEPGVVIEFESNSGFMVGSYSPNSGYITAISDTFIDQGEVDESLKIVFTGKVKSPGFWRGIGIRSNDLRNKFQNCIFEYAGSEKVSSFSAGFGFKAAISTGVSSNGSVGSVSIINSIFKNNNSKGYASKNGVGINQFSSNEFINNSEEAIFIHIAGFSKIDAQTSFSNNGFNGIAQDNSFTTPQRITTTTPLTWKNTNGKYRIRRNVVLDNTASLNILPDVKILLGSDVLFTVEDEAILKAIGTSSKRISFTKENNSSGSWKAILFKSNSNNQLKYCNISGGGSEIIVGNGCNGKANIGLWKWFSTVGKLTIENSIISDSEGCGIYNENDDSSNLNETNNTYTNNVDSGICN